MDLASLTADVWKGPMGLLRIAICVGLLVFFSLDFLRATDQLFIVIAGMLLDSTSIQLL